MSEVVEQLTARRSALAEVHARRGALMSEREGWGVAAHYGDAAAEYEAVRGARGAGLIDLSSRGRVEVAGAEAVQFLNGMITNDVKALAEGAWMSAAFPNPQGRLLAFARVFNRGGSFLIDTEAATAARVLQSLERFTLAGDFRVTDWTEETAQLSVQGARAAHVVGAVLGAQVSSVAPGRVADARWQATGVMLARATHTAEDGFDLFVQSAYAASLWEALEAAGARAVGFDALETLRVEAGVPRYGVDVTDSNVVLEAGQAEAVSFTKGCYVGQEIIARVHWRGHVAKQLAGVVLEGVSAAEPGSKIKTEEGKEAGRVTSSVFSPRVGRAVALGIVKYDYLKPGTTLRVVGEEAEATATVAELPFVRGSWPASAQGAGGPS